MPKDKEIHNPIADMDRKLQSLRDGLKIDRNSLDTELEQQPEFFNEAGELAALCRSRMDEAKEQCGIVSAEVENEYRRKHSNGKSKEKGEKGITDKAIKAMVETDERVQKATRKFLRLKLQTDIAEQVKESWRQRNYMIRELASLYIAGYFQSHSAGASGAKANEFRTSKAEGISKRLADKKRSRLERDEED